MRYFGLPHPVLSSVPHERKSRCQTPRACLSGRQLSKCAGGTLLLEKEIRQQSASGAEKHHQCSCADCWLESLCRSTLPFSAVDNSLPCSRSGRESLLLLSAFRRWHRPRRKTAWRCSARPLQKPFSGSFSFRL